MLPHCIIAQSSSSSSSSLEWKDNMTYELLQPPAEADAVSVEDGELEGPEEEVDVAHRVRS